MNIIELITQRTPSPSAEPSVDSNVNIEGAIDFSLDDPVIQLPLEDINHVQVLPESEMPLSSEEFLGDLMLPPLVEEVSKPLLRKSLNVSPSIALPLKAESSVAIKDTNIADVNPHHSIRSKQKPPVEPAIIRVTPSNVDAIITVPVVAPLHISQSEFIVTHNNSTAIPAEVRGHNPAPTDGKAPDIADLSNEPLERKLPNIQREVTTSDIHPKLQQATQGKVSSAEFEVILAQTRTSFDLLDGIDKAPMTALTETRAHTPTKIEMSPPNTRNIINQITVAISNTSDGKVELRLDPPELGRIHITLTQTDSGFTAQILTDKADITELLRRNGDILERELAKSGIKDASLSFSHHQGDNAPSDEHTVPQNAVFIDEGLQAQTIETSSIHTVQTLNRLDIRL